MFLLGFLAGLQSIDRAGFLFPTTSFQKFYIRFMDESLAERVLRRALGLQIQSGWTTTRSYVR